MKKGGGFKILLFSAIAIKAMGFFYKLPLANCLGEEMLGVYQLIFPIYALILTLTSSSLTSAIAGRYALFDGFSENCDGFLTKSGLIGSVALLLAAYPLAWLFKEERVALCFVILSPSVYFVARCAFYRGISQGRENFSATAVSEICEQLVKIAVSLPLLFIIKDKYVALISAVFAITVSEVVAAAYLKRKVQFVRVKGKSALRSKDLTLHVISFAVFPVCAFAESAFFVRFFGGVSAYGLYSGVALVVCGISATAISALSVSILPKIAEKANRKKSITSAVVASLMISIPFTIGIFLYPKEIVSVLFPRLAESGETAAYYLRLCSLIPVFQGLQLVTTASMYGKREEKGALIALATGGASKIVTLIFGSIFSFGVETAIVSALIQYLLAAAINLVYIIREREFGFDVSKAFAVSTYVLLVLIGTLAAKMYIKSLPALFTSVLYVGALLLFFALTMKLTLSNNEKGKENNVG